MMNSLINLHFSLLIVFFAWWLWRQYHPLDLMWARHPRMALGDLHGVTGWGASCVLNGSVALLLLLKTAPLDPTQCLLFCCVVGSSVLIIWSAPAGLRLPDSTGIKWFSNGHHMSAHMINNYEWKVSKALLAEQATQIRQLISQTGLPIYLSSPRNLGGLMRLLRQDPTLQVINRPTTLLAPILYPFVVWRYHQRSRIPWRHALRKSWFNHHWQIMPARPA